MTHWLTNTTGAAIVFMAGIVVGALLWQWRTAAKLRRDIRRIHKPTPLLWDIHSVLNAMNKLALAAERGRPVEPSLVYLLSDYLLHSALIQREDNWTDRNALQSWLLAHVRVVADHRGQNSPPAVTVQMNEGIRRIHASQLLRQLLWFLQKAQSISRIHIQVFSPSRPGHMAKVRIEIEGDQMEMDNSNMPVDETVTSVWRQESGMSTCELRTRFEAGIGIA